MFNKLIVLIANTLFRLLSFSYRYKMTGAEHLPMSKEKQPQGGYILASWHQHTLSAVLSHLDQNYTLLISKSADGQIVSDICHRLGFLTVRGSSSRGGKEAREQLVSMIKQGHPIAVTVDGPRGPLHQCKPGVIAMAKETGAPLIPIALASSHAYTFKKSWDQHRLPYPGSKIIFRYGEPLYIPKEISPEEFSKYQDLLNQSLHETQKQAEEDLLRWNH